MKVLENRRTGISLVALIVTIIVLIILTGAVIVTFMEGGIIDRAKDAVARNDLATLKEVYSLKYNKKKIDVDTGSTEGIDKTLILEEAVKEINKEKDFIFQKYGTVNSVTYIGDNKYISEWVNELLYTDEEINADNYEGRFAIKNGKLSTFSVTLADINGQLGVEYTAKDINGNDIEDDSQKLGTGTKIYNGDEEILTVVLFGDTDGSTLFSGIDVSNIQVLVDGTISASEVDDSVLYAADVNHDGYISQEDATIELLLSVSITQQEYFKTINITNKLPQVVNGYAYLYLTQEDVLNAFENNGYTVDYENNNVTIESGKTYGWLDSEIKRILSTDKIIITKKKVDIQGSEEEIIPTTNTQIQNGISIRIKEKEISEEYPNSFSLYILVKVEQ